MPAQKPSKNPTPNLNKPSQGQKPGTTAPQSGSKGAEEKKSGQNISSGKK
ncbi:MAG: hypothetical protein ACXVLQ_10695 [Bacteriovorax sp.]